MPQVADESTYSVSETESELHLVWECDDQSIIWERVCLCSLRMSTLAISMPKEHSLFAMGVTLASQ